MNRHVLLLPLGVWGGCLAPNPEYNPAASGGGTGGASSDVSESDVGSEGLEDSSSGSLSSGHSGTDSGSTDSGISGSGSSTGSSSTGGAASSSTGEVLPPLEPTDLGHDCALSNECRGLGPSVECCANPECLGTCMVACEEDAECPFAEMGCAHGYCLFPCEDNDADCEAWPGFTCQHGGNTLCENDEP